MIMHADHLVGRLGRRYNELHVTCSPPSASIGQYPQAKRIRTDHAVDSQKDVYCGIAFNMVLGPRADWSRGHRECSSIRNEVLSKDMDIFLLLKMFLVAPSDQRSKKIEEGLEIA